MEKLPKTIDQLPPDAETYYRESVKSGVFEYEYIGKDYYGNKVYRKYLNGEPYGRPMALLSFSQYRKAVKEAAKLVPYGMGVCRWTEPYYE